MTHENNGILALIPGAAIAAGSQSLPLPGLGRPPELEAVVDAGERGMVRIKYELRRHRHGKSESWFWTASYAEPAEPGSTNAP